MDRMNTVQEGHAAEQVVATLNRQQANALVLYLNYKKYHWLTYGPLFRDIHLLFDENAAQVLGMIDEFAERALMIDGAPLGNPATYLPAASVRASEGVSELRDMISEAVENLEVVIRELHADAATATAIDDIGTTDLYTRLVQDYQKQRWFLKEVLRKGDGLVT
jgi:starvation-inducible DNA-binding protein